RPVPTGTPALRSARPKATSFAVASFTCELWELRFDAAQVVAVLDRPAERFPCGGAVSGRGAEERERLRPVDRLGDARSLHEVERAQLPDDRRHRPGELLRDTGGAQPDDLHLALELGEVDPVV